MRRIWRFALKRRSILGITGGLGGRGGSRRLRDGGQRLHQRQLRGWPRGPMTLASGSTTSPAGPSPAATSTTWSTTGRPPTATKSLDLNGFGPGGIEQTFATTINSTYCRPVLAVRQPGQPRRSIPNGDASPSNKTMTVSATGGDDRRLRFDTDAKGNTFDDMKWADAGLHVQGDGRDHDLDLHQHHRRRFRPRPRQGHRDRESSRPAPTARTTAGGPWSTATATVQEPGCLRQLLREERRNSDRQLGLAATWPQLAATVRLITTAPGSSAGAVTCPAMTDPRHRAWDDIHDLLPAGWHVGPASSATTPSRPVWTVTAHGPVRGRRKPPETITRRGRGRARGADVPRAGAARAGPARPDGRPRAAGAAGLLPRRAGREPGGDGRADDGRGAGAGDRAVPGRVGLPAHPFAVSPARRRDLAFRPSPSRAPRRGIATGGLRKLAARSARHQ